MTTDYDIHIADTQPRWHTSSYSGGQGNCVEVACTPAGVPVRDSKRYASPILNFSREAWTAFVHQLG
jgi:uncharacterized protein DUF397